MVPDAALTPSSKEAGRPLKGRIGLDDLADKDVFGRLRGLIPAQPGDMSRVWGVSSVAASPRFGCVYREDVAQKCGRRLPASSRQECGTHSGLWLPVVDPDATASAPGVASYVKEEAAGRASSEVSENSDILGNVFAERFGDCSTGRNDTQVLVENATGARGQVRAGSRVSPLRIPRWRAGRAGGLVCSRCSRVHGVAEVASVRWVPLVKVAEVSLRSVLPVRGAYADVRVLTRFVVQ